MKKYIFILALSIILNTLPSIASDNTEKNENLFSPEYQCEPSIEAATIKTRNNCRELIERMFNNRAATYNVLNLTKQQKLCKDDIEKRRYQELDIKVNTLEQEMYVLEKLECFPDANKTAIAKQKKVINSLENDINNIMQKYDKEFKKMLSGEQKAKYKFIERMKRKDIKKCEKNKTLYKQDPNLQPFGTPYYEEDDICPKHGVKHLSGRKCKIK